MFSSIYCRNKNFKKEHSKAIIIIVKIIYNEIFFILKLFTFAQKNAIIK